GERAGHLNGDLQRIAQTEGTDFFTQSLPFDKFRRDEMRMGFLSDFMNGNDVRMIERGGSFGFLDESPKTLVVAGKSSRQKFERNAPIQPAIFSQIHLAHSTFAEQTQNPIMADHPLSAGFGINFRKYSNSGSDGRRFEETSLLIVNSQ